MDRNIPIVNNEPYHVYNRGNNRETIFRQTSDYEAFIKKMNGTALKYGVEVVGYVLMPNHFHMLLIQRRGGGIPKMMEALGTSTAKRYNLKYKHVGHLFQGPYRYSFIATTEGIAEVLRYIHLNPVRARLVKLPEQWPWSDFRRHVEGNVDEGFLEPSLHSDQGNLLPRLPANYAEFVREGNAKPSSTIPSPKIWVSSTTRPHR